MFCVSLFLLVLSGAVLNYGAVEAVKTVKFDGKVIIPVFTPIKNNKNYDIDLSVIPSYAAYIHKAYSNCSQQAIQLFGIPAEPFSLNINDKKRIIKAWVNENKKNNYGFVIFISVSFLPYTDACQVAAYGESLNVAAIGFKPSSDVGPSTPSQAVSDLQYIAKCAPKTPLYFVRDINFVKSSQDPDVAKVVKLAIAKIPSFGGFIGNLEQAEQARALNPDTNAQFIVIFYYTLSTVTSQKFDGFVSLFSNFLPDLVQQVTNAQNTNQSLRAQRSLNVVASALCMLRDDCRLSCPLNVMKAAMVVKTKVKVGTTRPPLCPVSKSDIADATKILKSNGQL